MAESPDISESPTDKGGGEVISPGQREIPPPSGLPTLFADFVSAVGAGEGGIVRFYFVRVDQPIHSESKAAQTYLSPVCQMVMPLDGFVNTAVFFSSHLENLINRGAISKDKVDSVRVAFSKQFSSDVK